MFDERYYKKTHSINNIHTVNRLASMSFGNIFRDDSVDRLNVDMAFDVMVRTYTQTGTCRHIVLVAALIVCGVDVSEHDDCIRFITEDSIDAFERNLHDISSTSVLSLFVLIHYTKTEKKYNFVNSFESLSLYGVNTLYSLRVLIEKKYLNTEIFSEMLELPHVIVCLPFINSTESEYLLNRFRLSSPSYLSTAVNKTIDRINKLKVTRPYDFSGEEFEYSVNVIRKFIEYYVHETTESGET